MFKFELLFLHGFSSKKIVKFLNKAVLTPQDDLFGFFFKMQKKLQKTCVGCLLKSKLVSKINLF